MRLHTVLRAFWLKPVSIFGLLGITAFIEGSHLFTVPSILAPSPPDAGRYTVPLRFGCRPCGRGYIVRGLLTARYLAAVPRRILLMGQQVWSKLPPDDHSRGFHVATFSYSQCTESTRAGTGTAHRASRTGVALRDLAGNHAQPLGLVFQACAKVAPPGIVDGFGHTSFGKLWTADITDGNQLHPLDDGRGSFMRPVLAAMGNFGMDGFDTPLFVGTLRSCQCLFVLPCQIFSRVWRASIIASATFCP